ncbi:MAG: phosphatidylserine/phosphatidylglycerophosphate/cardiolipin synthase family protein [Bacteriovoracaceae bacterium]|nr:phosphatidylserine/phosphatidylglycerophosphate/cardiolipin synthase family protein [Bacteriovoracaceae bacterium]
MAELPSYIFRRSGLPPLWTSEDLYFDGDEFYAEILKDIDKAESLITMEMYILEDDPLGERFFQSLNAAAERGVKVFLMLDGVGSHNFIQKIQNRDYSQNLKIKIYNPHPWTFANEHFIDFFKMAQVFLKRLIGVNKRDHRKIITIDERTSYTGSFNISTNHSKEFSQDDAWHDIGLKLTGWIAPLFILSLMKSWGLTAFFKYKRKMPKKRFIKFTHPDVRFNQSFRLRRALYKDFLKRIKRSKKRIWLSTGYFQPRRRIIRLLKDAAKRGVDVRILLSTKSDVFYYSLLQTYYHYELIKAGVRIYEYDPTVIHAKNYFLDDWITVGSTNLNYRSFMHDLEVDVRVQHPENKKKLNTNFEKLQTESKGITMKTLSERKWYIQWASRFVFLFRYWN